ncbi:MAG: alpha/beta hydrolase [Pseudomonadota bacterium]
MTFKRHLGWLLAAIAGIALAGPETALPDGYTDALRSEFHVGGSYVADAGKTVMQGQMYVEVLQPRRITRKYPLVFIHGGGQTASNWLKTPDNRMGWAQYFVAQGYQVYVVDQPARGRSAWHAGINGPLETAPVEMVEKYFTATSELGNWPQARKHTQWPGAGAGKGRRGDPVFDAFFATQVDYLNDAAAQPLVQAAGAALLDRIGPAILVTHSQSGTFGWLIADARRDLVKGIVALEPNGPPVMPARGGKARAYGLSDTPLTYAPALAPGEALRFVEQAEAAGAAQLKCWAQAEPARKLTRLAGLPVLIVTTEASYHASFDHCTHAYLAQAGVNNDFWRLEQHGIFGNGHMMMLEKNSLEIAGKLNQWISKVE